MNRELPRTESIQQENITLDKQAKHKNQEINWSVGALHCKDHKTGHQKNLSVFGELQNVVMEEKKDDKMIRESN